MKLIFICILLTLIFFSISVIVDKQIKLYKNLIELTKENQKILIEIK